MLNASTNYIQLFSSFPLALSHMCQINMAFTGTISFFIQPIDKLITVDMFLIDS
jgi:hypothetical protein